MPSAPIREDLRRFILTSVPSVPFVEALILFRDARGAEMTLDVLASRLYIDRRRAAEVVRQLEGARVVEPAAEGAWRYAPPQDVVPLVEQLLEAYRSNLMEVTRLIHSSTGRLAQHFADAFTWRKD
jgi:hypothetical protein